MKDNTILYSAFKSKDPRFDGSFFVGIKSTGIYCRPTCRAKLPKFENCEFYNTAIEAEQAGYRPCLLCRPEIESNFSNIDVSANLAHKIAELIQKRFKNKISLKNIVEELDCTDRHLRRVFLTTYGISPIQYLQTYRLIFAKDLLINKKLPVFEVAKKSGFGSLRRFNDYFKKQYNVSPTDFKKELINKYNDKGIFLTLNYNPPYCWEQLLSFLEHRVIKGVELVKNGEYLRTVNIRTNEEKNIKGWIKITNNSKKNNLAIMMSESLLPAMSQVLNRIKHLFDLQCNPHVIYEKISSMNNIKPNICVLGTRVPGCFDTFEMITRVVLGQQITVKVANTLISRIVNTYGTPIETGIDGLTHIFPTPEDILNLKGNIEDNFGLLGITAIRSNVIHELAHLIVEKEIDFNLYTKPELIIKKLMTIKGIGSWTAKYIVMRTMGWTDAFLETDVGIKKALKSYSPKEMLEMSKSWRPWRSYVTINLWNSL